MDKKNQIIGIELNELIEIIQRTVKNEIESCIQHSKFGVEFKDEVWDRKKVADFLGISPDKVTYLFNQKEITGKKLGGEYIFLKSQILKLFNSKK